MKVGVIVSSYNRPFFVAQALESIKRQTISDQIYVVVVADGSNQETRDAINAYAGAFGGFKLVQSRPVEDDQRQITNRVAVGVNVGLKFIWGLPPKEKPKYISYLGDDDLYFTDRCEKMVNFLDANRDIFLVYHWMEIHRCDKEGNLTEKLLDLCEEWTPANHFWVASIYNRIDHISFVHRNSQYLWDEDDEFTRASDWGFLLRLLSLEERFTHFPEYLAQGRKIEGDSLNMDGACSDRVSKGDEDGEALHSDG
jgi:spore maturation protein CgeD